MRQLAYVANTACDRHNFVLGFHLGAGNIHDSQMFHEVFKKLEAFKSEIKAVAVDAGYKTPGMRSQKPPAHGKNSFFEKIKYKLLYKAKIWLDKIYYDIRYT